MTRLSSILGWVLTVSFGAIALLILGINAAQGNSNNWGMMWLDWACICCMPLQRLLVARLGTSRIGLALPLFGVVR